MRRQPLDEDEPQEETETGIGEEELEEPAEEELSAAEPPQEEEEEAVRAKEAPGATPALSPATEASLGRLRGGGEPLPAPVRSYFEPRFGRDFGSVRLHTGEEAAQTARELEARAFTLGNDVVFGRGELAPETSAGRFLLAHELTHVVQQEGDSSPPIRRFAVTRADRVPSPTIRAWSTGTGRLPTAWGLVRQRLGQRDTTIAAMLPLVGARDAARPVLVRLAARWAALRRLAGLPGFNPATGRLPRSAALDAARTAETADLGALTQPRFQFVRADCSDFLAALDQYRRDRATLAEERTEYHRFDREFTHAVVTRLLRAIPNARFTSADLKALVDQETGDLTNTTVAGITGKTRGIRTSVPNPASFAGLGQHSVVSRNEAITWAAAQGVTIPRRPDPRTIPRQSIRLAAAYLGRTMQILWPGLPATKPRGDELKKMIFAAYNGGAPAVRDAARSFVGSTPQTYTWNQIKSQPTVTGQMRNYVAEIVDRLS